MNQQIKKVIPQAVIFKYRQYRDVKHIWQWTPEDEGRKSFYSNFVSPGSLVFDVGANLGNRTKVFDRLGAKVIAVEPQPRCSGVLKGAYSFNKSVTVVPSAVGEKVGEAQMFLSDVHELSTIAPDWMNKVKTTGRFGEATWSQRITVKVTTLDDLIRQYGRPKFIKIDVEGFEYEVLKGLTGPVEALSFEYTPEADSIALSCISRLDQLGMKEFNLAVGESPRLYSDSWLSAGEMQKLISGFENDTAMFGDIYARSSK